MTLIVLISARNAKSYSVVSDKKRDSTSETEKGTKKSEHLITY